VRVVAVGAVSGLGTGKAAFDFGAPGEPAQSALREDPALAAAGLGRPRCARATIDDSHADRATTLLASAFDQVAAALDRDLPSWRQRRLGLAIGTSSGGMISAERWFAARLEGRALDREDTARASYFAPLDDASPRLGEIAFAKRSQIVAACASSTIAIGLGMRWLDRGACDLVLAGGYDGLGIFVAAGFEALRATSASFPRPFCLGRDGMLLGEGAAVIALSRDDQPVRFFVSGFGASADAVHITAPDREAGGLKRAATRALEEAQCPAGRIDLVSAHGTATPYNDAAEAKALAALCPHDPVVHPFKSQIGHTLGAAGVLELLAAGHALERGVLPASFGVDAPDPEAPARLLATNTAAPVEAVLKLSAAFGGVTAALVASRDARDRARRTPRPVHLAGHARVADYDREALAGATGLARDRLARIDDLGQLTLAAVAELAAAVGRDALAGAGVIAGHALATLDTNAIFHRRLHEKGPRWVDPRLFPATSPNAGAGQVAIAFGLTGPNFAVNRGLDGGLEALEVGAELVAMGDAERIVVVAADDDGPAARAWLETVAPGQRHARGGVALLLTADATGPAIPLDDLSDPARVGHLALVDWIDRLPAR
jgi:3-oxoacyl-[acyl-carrier-protein] synthase II